MKISDLDFLRLIPVFMRDDEAIIAFAKAMNRFLGEPGKNIYKLRTWDVIDDLGEADLDDLAWELEIDWYDSTVSIDRKRSIIKTAIEVKRRRGTKSAVELMVTAYMGDCTVIEWFEYDDIPYLFKVHIDECDVLTENGVTGLFEAIWKVKNVRSHMRALEIARSTELIFYAGVGQFSVTKPAAIMDGGTSEKTTDGEFMAGVGAKQLSKTSVLINTM